MKRLLAVLLSIVLAVSFAACSKPATDETTLAPEESTSATVDGESGTEGETESQPDDTATQTEAVAEPVTNENGDVLIVMPSSFYDEGVEPSAEITDEMKEHGVKDAYVNEQGTLTYVVGAESYEGLKAYMYDQVGEALSQYPQRQTFVKNVACSADFSVINLQVDREGYEETMGNFAIVWEAGLYGQMYQIFAGVPEESLNVNVILTDVDTGEAIEKAHYPSNQN